MATLRSSDRKNQTLAGSSQWRNRTAARICGCQPKYFWRTIPKLSWRGMQKGFFRMLPSHESFQTILGQTRHYEALLSEELIQQLLECQEKLQLPAPVMDGNTLSMGDFYEGHGRLDGAFCDYTHIERIRFLQKCLTHYGICNTDTSAMVFAALTHRAGVEGRPNAPWWQFEKAPLHGNKRRTRNRLQGLIRLIQQIIQMKGLSFLYRVRQDKWTNF